MLIGGQFLDEMNLYFVPTGVREKGRRPDALRFILSRVQPKAGAILRAYGLGRKGVRGGHALTAAMTDLVFRWPARRFAEEHKGRTHVYEFGWKSQACGGKLEACATATPVAAFRFQHSRLRHRTNGFGRTPTAAGPGRHRPSRSGWISPAMGPCTGVKYSRDDRQVYHLETSHAEAEPVAPAAAFLP